MSLAFLDYPSKLWMYLLLLVLFLFLSIGVGKNFKLTGIFISIISLLAISSLAFYDEISQKDFDLSQIDQSIRMAYNIEMEHTQIEEIYQNYLSGEGLYNYIEIEGTYMLYRIKNNKLYLYKKVSDNVYVTIL